MGVMNKTTKERLLLAINKVVPLSDYEPSDALFGVKNSISSVDMVYILMQLSKEFCFEISDGFVDAMEGITYSQFEELLISHENGKAA